MSLLDLGSRILGKKMEQAVPRGARQDAGLPLGARIGGLLEIPRAAFAILDGSLLDVPPEGQMQIEAISRLRLDDDPNLKLHRFYVSRGAYGQGEGENFLQVLGDDDNIRDIAYYQFLCRQIPQTEEEQAPFKGQGFGLGEADFWLGEDLLSTSRKNMEILKVFLSEEGGLHYTRDMPGGAYVRPFTCRETRIDDVAGERGLTQRMWFMPYARTLSDGNQERLLISYEVVESIDGQKMPQVHVDYMIGLTLDKQRIKVL